MELFDSLGLNIKILLAQLVNFSVMLFVLWKFAYRPMKSFLEERRARIEKGVENAEKAEERLKQIDEKEEDVIKEAKKEAAKILEDARHQAEENKKRTIDKAKEDIGIIINKEKENMQIEKSETLKEIKKEIGRLVAQGVEKVLEEKMSSKKDKEIIEKAVKNIEK